MRRALLVTAATLVTLALAGCATDHGASYTRALAAASRDESSGRFGDAARAYDRSAQVATTRADAYHALYLGGRMYEQNHELELATARLDAVARITPPAEDSSAAALAAAKIRVRAGDPAGRAALRDIVVRFPASGAARVALHETVDDLRDTRGAPAAEAWLASLTVTAPELAHEELAQDIAYGIAGLREAQGDLAGARARYLDVAARWPYPRGSLWDDALFHASALAEKLGEPREAITDLETMLAQHENAHFTGSYQRSRYDPAAFHLAEIWRDELHDRAKARQAFHDLYTTMTHSLLRDDALWQESLLWAEEGDTGTACERLETLAGDFPDSRYVPCAAARCPRITRAPDSRAPRTCRPAIERAATEQQAKDAR